jgi:hypothetical protein
MIINIRTVINTYSCEITKNILCKLSLKKSPFYKLNCLKILVHILHLLNNKPQYARLISFNTKTTIF